MNLRFLGIEAEVHGKGLSKFGQPITLSDDQAKAAIAGNVPLLPDKEFLACGFTPEELERYAYSAARQDPGPNAPKQAEWKAFAAKWTAARVALHDYRERLRSVAEDPKPQPVGAIPAKKEGN